MCELYNRIHEECVKKGLNDATLCANLGYRASTLSDLKTNKKKTLSLEKTYAIAKYLGTTVEYLFAGETEKAHSQTESELDNELIKLLVDLTPSELLQVTAYAEGLKANRKV